MYDRPQWEKASSGQAGSDFTSVDCAAYGNPMRGYFVFAGRQTGSFTRWRRPVFSPVKHKQSKRDKNIEPPFRPPSIQKGLGFGQQPNSAKHKHQAFCLVFVLLFPDCRIPRNPCALPFYLRMRSCLVKRVRNRASCPISDPFVYPLSNQKFFKKPHKSQISISGS